jgi:hypothetical protein
MFTSDKFHTSQAVQVTESQRIVRRSSTCIFVGAMSLYMSTVLPSHWSQKLTTMAIATGLVSVSLRLDKLEESHKPYEAIAHETSTASYQSWLNYAMQPPKKEAQVTQEIVKPIPTHPILKALYGLKLECDFVQELRSPSFIRTLIKPANCKASQVLSTGQELQLELGLDLPPVMSIFKGAIAIDTPRPDRQSAKFADYWQKSPNFEAAIGVDINNKLVSVDLSQPESCHVLGAGTTGSGKSVFLQSFLLSLLIERPASELGLLICDAKRVSFLKFKDCSNLIAPIMSEPSEAIQWLEQMVNEMEQRYKLFERLGVENIEGFNHHSSEKLPRILFLFDEFGDLWDSCTKVQVDKLENLIIRLGQKARAAGIHLVVFTQRPKKVVSPRLRSNCPARVLLTVADAADSEAILGNKSFDGSQLLGRGDLFFNSDRLQALLADDSDFDKLTKGNNLQNPAQNTDLDNPSIASTLVNSSIAVNSSSTLSMPLIKILEYAKEKNCFITASQVKSGIRLFRDSPVTEIRSYFQWLADHQHGIVRGEADTLEFSAQ